MKLGIAPAFASPNGLGYQTLEYVKNLEPEKVMVCDISGYNKMPVYRDWYPHAWRWVTGPPKDQDYRDFLEGLDVVLYAETPLNYSLHSFANQLGVKTIQAANFEFIDYFRHPDYPKPSLIAMPSPWKVDEVKEMGWADATYLPVPVNRDRFPFRRIRSCKTFIHIVGRPAVHDRNGTLNFLEAAKKIGNDFRYIIYYQPPKDRRACQYFEPVIREIRNTQKEINVELVADVENPEDLYKDGDVLVLTRRYGGLCLPMQEALSCGLPVVMTDICPNNKMLPNGWLARSTKQGSFFAHTEIDIYDADNRSLAQKMLQFADDSIIGGSNLLADEIAESLSWKTLKPKYFDIMETLCKK